MNKRRRFKAKRRRLVERRMRPHPMLRFHRYAFALVWPATEIYAAPPWRYDVLYGGAWFRDRLRDGVD